MLSLSADQKAKVYTASLENTKAIQELHQKYASDPAFIQSRSKELEETRLKTLKGVLSTEQWDKYDNYLKGQVAAPVKSDAPTVTAEATPELKAKIQTEKMTKALNLNSGQSGVIYQANLIANQKISGLVKGAGKKGDVEAKIKKLNKERHASIIKLLTPAQKEIYTSKGGSFIE